MENILSAQYKRALELGIPEGLAKQFRKDIYTFKFEWRRARDLLFLSRKEA
jgi:hypothetical protein